MLQYPSRVCRRAGAPLSRPNRNGRPRLQRGGRRDAGIQIRPVGLRNITIQLCCLADLVLHTSAEQREVSVARIRYREAGIADHAIEPGIDDLIAYTRCDRKPGCHPKKILHECCIIVRMKMKVDAIGLYQAEIEITSCGAGAFLPARRPVAQLTPQQA